MSIYRVTTNRYRGHSQGELFEATLPDDTERRAVRFGAIELVEDSTPALRPGSYRLPHGWQEQKTRSRATAQKE